MNMTDPGHYDNPTIDDDRRSNYTYITYQYYEKGKKALKAIWKKKSFRIVCLFLALLITCVVIVVVVLATASN